MHNDPLRRVYTQSSVLAAGGRGRPCTTWHQQQAGALGERGKEEGSRGATDCKEVPLRPQQSTAGQGSLTPLTCPAQQQPEEPTLPQQQERPGVGARGRQAARAWLGVSFPRILATEREPGLGETATAPTVFPDHWKQDAAGGSLLPADGRWGRRPRVLAPVPSSPRVDTNHPRLPRDALATTPTIF